MRFDITRLPVGEMLVGFVLAATVGTFVLAFAFANGGGGGAPAASESPAATETPPAAETPPAGETPRAGGAIAVSQGDNFFDPKEVTVKAGASVTFDITNDGAAIHNMHIAGADGRFDAADDAVSDPNLLRGGDTATLAWTAPAQAGDVPFRCDFHPTEMTGTITVE